MKKHGNTDNEVYAPSIQGDEPFDHVCETRLMTLKFFNFRKHCSMKVKPHLFDKGVQRALNKGMQNYLNDWKEYLIGTGVKITNPNHFVWVPGTAPYLYTLDKHWNFQELPRKYSLEWYQCFDVGAYLADFAMKLGEKIYPDLDWYIQNNNRHSFAIGGSSKRLLIFDLLYFDMEAQHWSDLIDDRVTDEEFLEKWGCPKCRNK